MDEHRVGDMLTHAIERGPDILSEAFGLLARAEGGAPTG
jgi:hypothetical protein